VGERKNISYIRKSLQPQRAWMERVGPACLKSKSATGRRVIFRCFLGCRRPHFGLFPYPTDDPLMIGWRFQQARSATVFHLRGFK